MEISQFHQSTKTDWGKVCCPRAPREFVVKEREIIKHILPSDLESQTNNCLHRIVYIFRQIDKLILNN